MAASVSGRSTPEATTVARRRPRRASASESRDDLVFKALAAAPRREIIRMLSAESDDAKSCCASTEVCACRFAEALGLSASTISHHMSVLTEAGLVSGRKDGTWVYYRLEIEALSAALASLASASTGTTRLTDHCT